MGTKENPKRVKQISKKVLKSGTYKTLKARMPNTRGKSKTALEEALEHSKKKRKEIQEFRLRDESDIEKVDSVSEGDKK